METKKENYGFIWYSADGIVDEFEKTAPQCGHYLLKDGSCSARTVYNQEKGILLNDNLYLPLNISRQKFRAAEAKAYFSAVKLEIPCLYQILLLQNAAKTLNKSFAAIGMGEDMIPEHALQNVWHKEAMEQADSQETRNCIFIRPRKDGMPQYDYEIINSKYLLVNHSRLYVLDGKEYKNINFVLIASNGFVDILKLEHENMFFARIDGEISYIGTRFDYTSLKQEAIISSIYTHKIKH